MDHGPACAQKARHECRLNTLSMADMHELISLGVPRKTLKAITLETVEPASASMNQHSSRDAVTEWTCSGLSMDDDDAGLNGDDNTFAGGGGGNRGRGHRGRGARRTNHQRLVTAKTEETPS